MLGIPVDEREPGRLDLHHEAVTLEEDVVVIPEREGPLGRLAGHQRVRLLVADEEPATPHFHGDGQLVAVQRPCVLTGAGAGVR